MTPINLSALPSTDPVPTGSVQLKRGAAGAGALTYNNTVAAQFIQDGAGNSMRVSITPPRAGMWLIRAETIWATPDAIWSYCHWGVRLTPADADGFYDDRNHLCIHSALSWTESVINTAYRLNANVPYYAEMYWPNSSSGYNQQVFIGPDYSFIAGEFVGEGSI